MVLTKRGKMIWGPGNFIQELEKVKDNEGLKDNSVAMSKMADFARIGRQLRGSSIFESFDSRPKRRKKKGDLF